MTRSVRAPLLLLLACCASGPAAAFVANIAPGSTSLYLRVGDGSASGNFNSGGTPTNNPTVNEVTLTVPAAALGNGTGLAMTGAGRLTSDYDGFAFCNPGEVYIGGYYRRPNTQNVSATLTVTAPPSLSSAGGDAIAISQISWTTRGNASGGGNEPGPQPVPAGTFAGGQQTLASFLRNTWRESCLSFVYANDDVVPAGTYTARVTYTLTSP